MSDLSNFKLWLTERIECSDKTISNYVSRFKRADRMLPWFNDPVYLFQLEQTEEFKSLSVDVRSQIKKAVKLYFDFENSHENLFFSKDTNFNVLSLFANIGVAEGYLKDLGVNVVLANELLEKRALLYSKIYPDTHMICGDITKQEIFDKIVKESIERNVNVILATPPCQGMSTVGQKNADDERNTLICQAVDAIKVIKPKYAFIENVPMLFNTEIMVGENKISIPDYLENELGRDYIINRSVIDTKDYSVPQSRERAIVLLTLKGQDKVWTIPEKDSIILTMRDAIGHLPSLDPYITDVNEDELKAMFPNFHERSNRALEISKWHRPPHHVKRQVVVMQHTPTGKTAFDNLHHYPIKSNGEAVKGFRNTYKRQNWDTPAYTVTMDNRKISSQDNVHPGNVEGFDKKGEIIYSDARVLTLYELMKIMSIPDNWPVPENTSEAFLRRIIGEGIPPLFVKKVFEKLI